MKDLALYLHQSTKSLRAWARRQGLLKWQSLNVHGASTNAEFVSRYGALRVIAHFRAMQGEMALAGKDYHRKQDQLKAARERQKRRHLSK